MNPILPPQFYIPDVEARQWEDGNVYLYGSMDKCGNDEYCSKQYFVFRSKNMKEWSVYRNSFTSASVHDKESRNVALYAPDCVKIGEKYCLFYCQEDRGEGVAFCDDPCGPFADARAIVPADKDGIDPAVLVDDDGSVYYFWGQARAKGGKLNVKTGEIIPGTLTEDILTESEHGFHEGISIRKRNGIYYLVYADISRGHPTCLGYAMSDKPLGPYVKKGIIIDNTGSDPENWNNHGSIAEINGKWYVFYHRASHNSKFSRRVCVEPIFFNPDGTIDEVIMTTQGIEEPLDCFKKLEAGRACALSGKCYVDDYSDGVQFFEYIMNIHGGDRLTYRYITIPDQPSGIVLEASSQNYGATVKVYLDENENDILTEIHIEETEGKYDFRKFFAEIQRKKIAGVHSLHLKMEGNKGTLACLKSIYFLK